MSIFGKIRDAIFGKKHAEATPTTTSGTQIGTGGAATAERPPLIDVENHLDSLPGADRLNWRTSIVDLMKLVGMDSSLENRKELATELGYQGAKDGSAEMNLWLHKEVMKQLAAHGGKVPASMAD